MGAAANPTITYCNRNDIVDLLSAYGVIGAVDDDADGNEDAGGDAFITNAINDGTNKVNKYLLSKYSAEELALSPIACDWAVVHACKYLVTRRGNPCPSSLAQECEEAVRDMREIQQGKAQLPDAAPRASGLPSHLNTRVDRNYPYGKIRVVRPESDESPADHPQRLDWGAEFYPYR